MKLSPHVTMTETESGAVLLDGRAGRYWQINQSAALALRHLLAGQSVEATVVKLRERFDDGRNEAADDVAHLVESLRRAKLVTS
ncbi:lasso peptide biosynthesis PqqD family chaperone [Micromonospora wenchangensis]|uniref:lasso peptide biosynthesis PqqD family chaperone n=1 Tax=Micromonospora wenchangensis TaxID=1185415 RepID=UPI00382AB5EE